MPQSFRNSIPVFLLLLTAYIDLSAQTCCTGSAPITGSIKIGAIDKGQFNFNLIYDHNSMTDLYIQKLKINENFLKRSTKTILIQSNYGINDRLSMGVIIPFISKSEQVNTSSSAYKVSTASLGDVSLLVQYSIVRKKTWLILIGSGIKFPSAPTQLKDAESQIVLQPSLQPGTGSYDYLFLTQFRYSLANRHSLSISQSFSYQLSGTSNLFAGHSSYKFGNELQSFSTISDQFILFNKVFTPSITLRLSRREKNFIEQFEDINSGGTWLYFSPGGTIRLTHYLSVVMQADLPIYRKINGFQLITSFIIRGGILISI